MKNERRNGDRYCFNLDLQPKGELILLVGERTVEVWKLLDISPFGIGLSIDEHINAGSKVALEYRCVEDGITLFGTVAWSGPENSAEEGGGFRMGVHFHRDKMVLNVSLFKTLTDPA